MREYLYKIFVYRNKNINLYQNYRKFLMDNMRFIFYQMIYFGLVGTEGYIRECVG